MQEIERMLTFTKSSDFDSNVVGVVVWSISKSHTMTNGCELIQSLRTQGNISLLGSIKCPRIHSLGTSVSNFKALLVPEQFNPLMHRALLFI
jgi:hypothetical protein